MSFPSFVLSPTAINLAGLANATWTPFASGAPAGASGMVVLLSPFSGAAVRELRKTGSTDNYVSDSCASPQQSVRWVGLNGSGQFDYYSAGTSQASDLIYPLAYFGSEATFPTNIIAMASTMTTSYASYSTGGNAPGGLAAVFAIHGSNDYDAYFRHPASTDDFSNGNEGATRRDWFCALDGSQQYASKAGNTGRQPYLVCYFTSSITTSINATVRTPGSSGSYQNLSSSGDVSPLGAVYHFHSPSSSYAYQISGQGTAWSAPNITSFGSYASNAVAYTPAQANIANTALVISELAYFIASPGASVAWLT